ncbi:MAG: hypothetical protein JO285_09410 [Kutzneria sp.]|nr:hypothetical protein [Kutzneria sp.]
MCYYRVPEDTIPVHGVMQYKRLPGGGLMEVDPDRCPNGHDVTAPGSMLRGWSPSSRRRNYSCHACDQDGLQPMWCVEDGEIPLYPGEEPPRGRKWRLISEAQPPS